MFPLGTRWQELPPPPEKLLDREKSARTSDTRNTCPHFNGVSRLVARGCRDILHFRGYSDGFGLPKSYLLSRIEDDKKADREFLVDSLLRFGIFRWVACRSPALASER